MFPASPGDCGVRGWTLGKAIRDRVRSVSGTDALTFAQVAAGVKAGDLVITVSNTLIATVEAISQAAGQPNFVDIDEQTCNVDVERLQKYLGGELCVYMTAMDFRTT